MIELAGQVVVYSVAGCPHCMAAKHSLHEYGLPFIEVSLDRFPAVRPWLKEKTGKTSVPQIFFNDSFVGGNDDLQRVMEDEDEWTKLLSEVKANKPTEGSILIPHPSEATDQVVSEFVCESDPSASIVEELQKSGILHDLRTSLFSRTKMAFSGKDFITWIITTKEFDEEKALSTARDLLNSKYVLPVEPSAEISFVNDPKVYYRLNDASGSSALNAGETQKCKLMGAGELSEMLRMMMLKLTTDYISTDGKVVDYKGMKNAELFKDYIKASKELQRVPVERLDQDELKAFFINIYNALVIHANVVNGPPSNWFSRMKFFDKISYIIGGYSYSLNDIENGVLRGNKAGPTQFFAPFGKSDPRLKARIIQVDPRIHFALNCGARSCPPIKTFTAKEVNAELQVATEAYLETDEALLIDESHFVVHLSSLFKWYSGDFGDDKDHLLQWVLNNVSHPEKKAALQRALDTNKCSVKYITYDWSTNSKD